MRYGTIWKPTDAALQRDRIRRVFGLYWLISITAGILLPDGKAMEYLSALAIAWTRPLDGLHQLISNSRDPGYVAVFVTFTSLLGIALLIVSWLWIPFGRPNRFQTFTKKLMFFVAVLVVVGFFFALLTITQSDRSLTQGRVALLYFCTQSRLGVITVINALFGFIPMCVFIALFEALKSPVPRFHT